MENDFLSSTYFYDYSSPEIQDLLVPFRNIRDKHQQVASIYTHIRDNWWYFPYRIGLLPEHYKASNIAKQTHGNCIEKSLLFIACMRAIDIPARLRLAKVKNHIGIEKFAEKFGSSEIAPHGMTEIFIGDKWVKASPAFNKELCARCNVPPLDFNGKEDSLFQAYDRDGNTFMEYIEDYGFFADFPIDFTLQKLLNQYPAIQVKEGQEEINI